MRNRATYVPINNLHSYFCVLFFGNFIHACNVFWSRLHPLVSPPHSYHPFFSTCLFPAFLTFGFVSDLLSLRKTIPVTTGLRLSIWVLNCNSLWIFFSLSLFVRNSLVGCVPILNLGKIMKGRIQLIPSGYILGNSLWL